MVPGNKYKWFQEKNIKAIEHIEHKTAGSVLQASPSVLLDYIQKKGVARDKHQV